MPTDRQYHPEAEAAVQPEWWPSPRGDIGRSP